MVPSRREAGLTSPCGTDRDTARKGGTSDGKIVISSEK